MDLRRTCARRARPPHGVKQPDFTQELPRKLLPTRAKESCCIPSSAASAPSSSPTSPVGTADISCSSARPDGSVGLVLGVHASSSREVPGLSELRCTVTVLVFGRQAVANRQGRG